MTAASRLLATVARPLLAGLVLAGPALAQGIEVQDAFVFVARPGAPSAAAYMAIRNPGGAPDRLVAAASPAAERVELHQSVTDADGTARMVPLPDGIELPAGGEVVLARGGLHVMLLGVDPALADGDVVALTLVFEAAGEVVVEAPVDTDPAAGLGDLGGGHGGHGG